MVGVYSAQPSGALSLLARVRRFGVADWERLEDERLAVRIPAMRTSGHLVAVEDADVVWAATARPIERHAWRLREAGIGDDEYRRLRAAVLAAATTPRTARQLRDDVGAGRPLSAVLSMMVFDGSLVAVRPDGLRSAASRHVVTETWLGRPLRAVDLDRGKALAWLAAAYLRAFGPARAEDFRWWAGVTAAGAGAAVATVDTVDVGGGLLLPAGDLPAFERLRRPRSGTVDVVPKWDCWTMGYPRDGRARFVDPYVQRRVYDRDGNALGMVLADGLAAAAWTLREERGRLVVEVDWLDRPGPALAGAAADRLADVATFLGFGGRLDVRTVPPAG